MESDCKTHDGDVGLGKHAKGSAKSRPVEEATLQMQHRFRTDRAGLSKSMGCIGKPSLAATLTRKGFLAHWQTWSSIVGRTWR